MMGPKDERILQARTQRWDARQGPRVGDFVIMKDGSIRPGATRCRQPARDKSASSTSIAPVT